MEVEKAKEILESVGEAEETLRQEKLRKQKERRDEAVKNLEEAYEAENFQKAKSILEGQDLKGDSKECMEIRREWRKKIHIKEIEAIKATIPSSLAPLALPCQNCGGIAELGDENIIDTVKLLLVGFCKDCNKRTIFCLSRKVIRAANPIESYLKPLIDSEFKL